MGISHLTMLLNCSINKLGREKSLTGFGGVKWAQMLQKLKKVDESKLANGTTVIGNEKQAQDSGTVEKSESVAGCCQGANGFTCCRDGNVEQKPIKKGAKGLSCWTENWEQRHILTTVAVVGAVATVAVAYGFYRRSR